MSSENSRLKFRAWYDDNHTKTMLHVGDEHGTRHPLDCCSYLMEGQPVTLMQYTGLKDKNGVDVYEGDILSAGDNITGVMEWHEDQAGFSRFFGEIHQFEIIGNIYEDPELLGDR